MDEFPPNSRRVQGNDKPPKRVERVTSAEAVRRKKSLSKQFKATFLAGDPRTAMNYVVFHVLIPAAKDALAEAGASGIEKLIFGEHRHGRRGGGGPSAGPTGYVNYRGMSSGRPDDRPPMPTRAGGISRRARARHDFDEIVLESRPEAEEVIDRLFDLISRYEVATLSDLYELTGLESSHTDNKWGWTEMRGASVSRVRSGGYLLNLPDPEPLD